MSAVLTGCSKCFGGFTVWTPHFVVAKADSLPDLLDPETVFLAGTEILAQKIPVLAVGEPPACRACVHGGFPCVETTVLVAVLVVIVVAVTATCLVREVFGKPIVVSDFYDSISMSVARILECFFRRRFFGGGGNGDTCY